jgi:protein-L-isoaspartate(D-aspartate) O-methyltransferase
MAPVGIAGSGSSERDRAIELMKGMIVVEGTFRRLPVAAFCLAQLLVQAGCGAQNPDATREEMVRTQIEARGVRDPKVLAAMRAVPRHEFVPETQRRFAYADSPLSIGSGQTISQPFIVALMTQMLQLAGSERVLEVGTGSGYQAAILHAIGCEVYTIEIVRELHAIARDRLLARGMRPEQIVLGDGYKGLPSAAPFDRIIVTAAPEEVPQSLIEQLKPGGRMVIPIGPVHSVQKLTLIEKDATGKVTRRATDAVSFVPLVRDQP